jgi:hypothetical protein
MIVRRADIVIAEHPDQAAAFSARVQKRKPPAEHAGGLPSFMDQNFSAYMANFK